MKNFMFAWGCLTSVLVLSTVVVLAQGVTPVASHSNGNQLMKDPSHWYEKAAETVGPVTELSAKGGTVLVLQPGSSVYMIGKSTLHDYQMTAHVLQGTAVLKGGSKDPLKSLQKGRVQALTFVVPIDTFKSKESGLDKNAYKALNSKEYPDIQFKLTGETLKAGQAAGTYVMTAPGTVTLAGEKFPVILNADVTVADGQVRVRGVQKLKFSDFKIKPPSATVFIVTITCSDEFEVHYDVVFGPFRK